MTLRTGHRRSSPQRAEAVGAFTLIELLLVMTLLAIVMSIAMPSLANFYRGRTLDAEARRLLSLTRHGQSRAVAEGIPMRLWVDSEERTYGVKEEPGWDEKDPKAVEFTLDKDLQIEPVRTNTAKLKLTSSRLMNNPALTDADRRDLPEIRFLPDGSIDDTSLSALKLSDRDGVVIWLTQSRNRLNYELRNERKE